MISQIVNLVAGGAALFLAGLFLVVTRKRGSSLAWINRLFSCVTLAISFECLASLFDGGGQVSESLTVMRILLAVALLTCAALCVPLYKRIRRHPQYDEVQAANNQLEYSRRLFKTFLDETPSAAYVIDAHDRFLYANSRLQQEVRTEVQDLVGTSLFDCFPLQAAQDIANHCKAVRSTRSGLEHLLTLKDNGNTRTYLLRMFPLPGLHSEQLVGVVSIEISEELQSRDMDSLLASIVELSPDAIYTVNQAGLVTSWNKGAEEMLGYSGGDIIGKPATLLTRNKGPEQLAEYINRLESGEVIINGGFIHFAKDASHKRVTMSATKIKSFIGAESSYAAIVHDETESRRAAAEMKTLNRELDIRIAQLSEANKELLVARDLAVEASSLKSAFVATMSHALRTPLSGILGMTELMLDKNLQDEDCDLVHTIKISAEALLKIVNDILDLSKLEDDRQTIEREPFSPRTLTQDCLKLLKPAAVEKGLPVNLSIDPNVPKNAYADAFKIRQILLNLLGNAVKFTQVGQVDLDVVLLSESGHEATLQFSVTDTGMGIADEHKHLLFNPFSRIEDTTRGITGSGLGLALSKRFAELMKGSIDFESTTGHGSKFIFTVPVLKTKIDAQTAMPIALAPTQDRSADRLQNCRVLAVEDNPVLSFLVMRQLANIGVIAECAHTGEEALEKVSATNFDVILMDINLPDLNGYEVTKRIRQTEQLYSGRKYVIIAMTAGAMPGDRERALAAGMNDYLAKPVSTAKLRETLLQWTATTDTAQEEPLRNDQLEQGTSRGK